MMTMKGLDQTQHRGCSLFFITCSTKKQASQDHKVQKYDFSGREINLQRNTVAMFPLWSDGSLMARQTSGTDGEAQVTLVRVIFEYCPGVGGCLCVRKYLLLFKVKERNSLSPSDCRVVIQASPCNIFCGNSKPKPAQLLLLSCIGYYGACFL